MRFLLLALLLSLSSPAVAAVEVVDGDTIRVDGQCVRLWGYDAPERLQTCRVNGVERAIGEEATEGLKAILAGGELCCTTKDRYGRTVADCWTGPQSIGMRWCARVGPGPSRGIARAIPARAGGGRAGRPRRLGGARQLRGAGAVPAATSLVGRDRR